MLINHGYSPGTAVGRSAGYHIVKQGALGGGTPHRSLISTMLTTVVSNSANHTCRISYISKWYLSTYLCYALLFVFLILATFIQIHKQRHTHTHTQLYKSPAPFSLPLFVPLHSCRLQGNAGAHRHVYILQHSHIFQETKSTVVSRSWNLPIH